MPIVITTNTTVTSSDIIRRALLALGYLGRTESMSAADSVDGLVALNTLLDSWSNEAFMSYVGLLSSQALTVGVSAYNLSGTSRPLMIAQAFIRDSNSNDFPVRIINQEQWNDIGLKTNRSDIPSALFYQSSYPNGVINLFPVPAAAYTLYYLWETNQPTFSLLTTTLSMPIGYERMFVMNLALELMSVGFPCMLKDRDYLRLVENASEAKANIKRTNIKEVIADYDPAITRQSGVGYNINSDSYR